MKPVHIAVICLFAAAGVCYLAAFNEGLVVFAVLGLGLELAGLLGVFGASKADQLIHSNVGSVHVCSAAFLQQLQGVASGDSVRPNQAFKPTAGVGSVVNHASAAGGGLTQALGR